MCKRIVFNINRFIEDLENCFSHHRYDLIDDVANRYKDFLREAKPSIKSATIKYTNNHEIVSDNEIVKSYIVACHNEVL